MYTDKDYIINYGIYNLNNKSFNKLFKKPNIGYSDFAIDEEKNIIYYSDLINRKHNIYKVNLSDKENEKEPLLNRFGDVFELGNNKIVFRTVSYDRLRYTLGTYDLNTKNIDILDNSYFNSSIFKFYWNKDTDTVYTIERPLIKTEEKDILEDNKEIIYKYSNNFKNRELIYSPGESIGSIEEFSVNKEEDKMLFSTSEMGNDELIIKFYLLNLNNNTKELLLKSNDEFKNSKFTRIKSSKLKSDNKGFYFTASTSEDNIIEKPKGTNPIAANGIYYYDFSSKEINLVFKNGDVFINDFKLN